MLVLYGHNPKNIRAGDALVERALTPDLSAGGSNARPLDDDSRLGVAMIDCGPVVLRSFEPADIDALYSFRNDPNITDVLTGFSFGFSRADLKDWIESQRHDRTRLVWAIATKEDDMCIGQIGLYEIDHRLGTAELGAQIGDKGQHGRGIGRLVYTAALRYAFEELRLHKVWGKILETNEPPLALTKKLGFRQDGVLRDAQFRKGRYANVVLISILDSEWFELHGEKKQP